MGRVPEGKGFDPENQLCTDDFAGHLAHNVNLSAKAIVALGAYGQLCEMRGDKAAAAEYRKLAKEFAAQWVKMAADGDHYRLAFDKPGTWSQKYNLVWDRLLGLNLFPAEVRQQEMAYYRKTQNRYGLPLDNRKAYTKLDWTMWTATLTGDRGDFEALVAPVYDFLNDTPDRVPMTDWYSTDTARSRLPGPLGGRRRVPQDALRRGDVAEVGRAGRRAAEHWAPLPAPPKYDASCRRPRASRSPGATRSQQAGRRLVPRTRSTTRRGRRPGRLRHARSRPARSSRTEWKTRRHLAPPRVQAAEASTAEAEVAASTTTRTPRSTSTACWPPSAGSYVSDYELTDIRPAALAALKPGKNVIAVHCHQTAAGSISTWGLVEVAPAGKK